MEANSDHQKLEVKENQEYAYQSIAMQVDAPSTQMDNGSQIDGDDFFFIDKNQTIIADGPPGKRAKAIELVKKIASTPENEELKIEPEEMIPFIAVKRENNTNILLANGSTIAIHFKKVGDAYEQSIIYNGIDGVGGAKDIVHKLEINAEPGDFIATMSDGGPLLMAHHLLLVQSSSNFTSAQQILDFDNQQISRFTLPLKRLLDKEKDESISALQRNFKDLCEMIKQGEEEVPLPTDDATIIITRINT